MPTLSHQVNSLIFISTFGSFSVNVGTVFLDNDNYSESYFMHVFHFRFRVLFILVPSR